MEPLTIYVILIFENMIVISQEQYQAQGRGKELNFDTGFSSLGVGNRRTIPTGFTSLAK